MGLGLPGHPPARRRRPRDGDPVRAGHVNETTEKVDNLGGILSAVLVGRPILGINFAPVPKPERLALGLFGIAIVAGVAFIVRQKRAANPLYDLKIAVAPRVLGRAAAPGSSSSGR